MLCGACKLIKKRGTEGLFKNVSNMPMSCKSTLGTNMGSNCRTLKAGQHQFVLKFVIISYMVYHLSGQLPMEGKLPLNCKEQLNDVQYIQSLY